MIKKEWNLGASSPLFVNPLPSRLDDPVSCGIENHPLSSNFSLLLLILYCICFGGVYLLLSCQAFQLKAPFCHLHHNSSDISTIKDFSLVDVNLIKLSLKAQLLFQELS